MTLIPIVNILTVMQPFFQIVRHFRVTSLTSRLKEKMLWPDLLIILHNMVALAKSAYAVALYSYCSGLEKNSIEQKSSQWAKLPKQWI